MSIELKQAIDDAGGAGKIAEHFGISAVSVYEWITRGSVPAEKCPEIEKFSAGVVRCEQLNDKVDWSYLRNTKAA
jgi:DNA-binding transcriptional regulator YdaS (Cro superfamily)